MKRVIADEDRDRLLLDDPAALLGAPDAVMLKDHRRTAVARVVRDGRELYVKRFKPYAWYRQVEAWWSGSPARRAWNAARLLRGRGFEVPRLVGFVERGGESWLVAEGVEGGSPGATFWYGESMSAAARRRLVSEAARTLRRFHDAGLYSRDTNANNFLVRTGGGGKTDFVFLDLENVRRLPSVGRRRRMKNLVQLHRLFRESVSRTVRLRFVTTYLGCTRSRDEPSARRHLRRWLAGLTRLDLAKEREYRRRAGRRSRDGTRESA